MASERSVCNSLLIKLSSHVCIASSQKDLGPDMHNYCKNVIGSARQVVKLKEKIRMLEAETASEPTIDTDEFIDAAVDLWDHLQSWEEAQAYPDSELRRGRTVASAVHHHAVAVGCLRGSAGGPF